MSDAQDLLKLVAQSQWANAKWVEVVYARATQDARPLELLAHILLRERVWIEESIASGLAEGGAPKRRGRQPPNQRLKLSGRGGRLKGKGSVLITAAAPHSLAAIR